MTKIVILIIFLITYYLIIFGKGKKSVVAFSMGLLALFVRVSENMTIKNISYFIDFNTLGILFGMMLLVAVLKSTGLFQAIAGYIVIKSKGNFLIIFVFILIAVAALSSILDNVTTLLLFTPVVLLICQEAGIKPYLFIFPMIFAGNIGGTATMIGDPPNILVSSAAKISFTEFLSVMIIPTIISFIVLIIYYLFSETDLKNINSERFSSLMKIEPIKAITNMKLLIKSLILFFFVIMGFIFHDNLELEASLIALSGGALALIISNSSFEDVSKEIEWNTIFFFFGLFTIVKALEDAKIIDYITQTFSVMTPFPLLLILLILWLSGILSSFMGNVPIATIFIPVVISLIPLIPSGDDLWWALALGASFGGNGTISGSASNLVVIGMMESNTKEKVSFISFMKKGFVVSIFGLIISSIFLTIKYII